MLDISLCLYFCFLDRIRKAIICLQIMKPSLGRLDYPLKRDNTIFLWDKTDFKTRDIILKAARF